MCDIINRFSINCHSSIRCDNGNMVLRFDPFRVEDTPHDAGLVFITHDHYDHFSPEDIRRVLSPGGAFVYVVPSEKHLWELKQVLYDRPYPNQVKQTPYPGFSYREIRHVESVIHLPCQEDIHALFQMTPYFWKTPKAGTERLAALTALDVTISFDIHVFCRD